MKLFSAFYEICNCNRKILFKTKYIFRIKYCLITQYITVTFGMNLSTGIIRCSQYLLCLPIDSKWFLEVLQQSFLKRIGTITVPSN